MAEKTDAEILLQFFNVLKAEVIANQMAKGIYASGQSAEGLETNAEKIEIGTVGQLIDTAGYFQQQEFGRGPTKGGSKGSQTLQQRIYDWLEFKKYGLTYSDEKQRRSLSYAIATKIHREGTLTYRLNKQTGVLSEILTPDRIKSLTSVFANKYGSQVRSDVLKSFNR